LSVASDPPTRAGLGQPFSGDDEKARTAGARTDMCVWISTKVVAAVDLTDFGRECGAGERRRAYGPHVAA